MVLIRKNKSGISHLNQIWISKTLTCILIKKLISYRIIFETNKYILKNKNIYIFYLFIFFLFFTFLKKFLLFIFFPQRYEDDGRMRELSIKELRCSSYSLVKVGEYYVNLDIK